MIVLNKITIIKALRITVPVLIITAIWRYSIIGGSAALGSIIYNMTVPVLIGLFFYQAEHKIFKFKKLFLLTTSIWLVTLLPLIWVTPNGLEIWLGNVYTR
jgi:diguanylate cyclase